MKTLRDVEKIFRDDGTIDGPLLEYWRDKRLHFTREEFGRKCTIIGTSGKPECLSKGVLEKNEKGQVKKPQGRTIRMLRVGLGLDQLPPVELAVPATIQKKAKYLFGTWFSYHWTHEKDGTSADLMFAKWSVKRPSADCIVSPRTKYAYKGSTRFEGDDRVVFTLDCDDEDFQERMIWRFPRPTSKKTTKLHGACFGLDYLHQPFASHAVLSKQSLKPTEAKLLLAEGRNLFIQPISA